MNLSCDCWWCQEEQKRADAQALEIRALREQNKRQSETILEMQRVARGRRLFRNIIKDMDQEAADAVMTYITALMNGAEEVA